MTNRESGPDRGNLQRFLDAQESTYEQALGELVAGEKRTHWMWFIFPQIRGLGTSSMAQRFAIADLGEAVAYLEHPVLGKRLRECTRMAHAAAERSSVRAVFGSPDDLKFRSSMTLFGRAAQRFGVGNEVFAEAIRGVLDGVEDAATIARIGGD